MTARLHIAAEQQHAYTPKAKFVDNAAPDVVSRTKNARQLRDDDQFLAALLIEGGLTDADVHAAPPDSDDQYVATDGEWTESLGRALRRHQMFPSQAYRAKVKHGLRYTAFAAENGIDAVRQVRVAAPVCSVPLTALRRIHAETSRRLADRLRYGIRRHAPGIAIDMIAAHIQRDGDGGVYLHFHIVARGGTDQEWGALESYWIGGTGRPETGWLWWAARDDDLLDRHPAALVQYAAAGLAEELDGEWLPEELAELWHQTRGVALIRPIGEYRRWLGHLDASGMTVKRHPEYGVVEIVPRRPAARVQRLREHLFANVGFSVLRHVVHDFGDGVPREAWHVRGRPGVTAADIRVVYRDVAAASTECAAYPGNAASQAVVRPRPPPDPPPQPPWIEARARGEVPW